ncbi:MAG: CBS domain-containing protein, partial [Candidatus Thorarchaeota archaeon]|nr:CBS domain-containing protein [Candidatus Thorarchaeota archaeon]
MNATYDIDMPPVSSIMSEPVITITPIRSVYDAAKLMVERDVECLIVAWGDQVEGIITLKDIVHRVVAEKLDYDTNIYEVMTTPVITVNIDDSIAEAREIMREHDITRLPVEDEGRLVGIVVLSDMVRRHSLLL